MWYGLSDGQAVQVINCKLAECVAVTSESNDIDLWHQRLGHLCEQQMKHMVNKELAISKDNHTLFLSRMC